MKGEIFLNNNENVNIFLESQPVGKLMLRYAVPLIISLLVAALYNIVDQIFIANADYLGSNGNAANNVVFPMTVIALAFTLMIGDGVCAFVSMSLGARESRQAGDSVGSALLLSSTCGIILAIIYYIFCDELLTFFGGRVNEETFRLAQEYFSYIIIGIPFYVFGQAMNPVISADGSPNYVMFSTLIGAGINIILDPLFIFVFHWGMMGAAVATVAGQIFTAGMSLLYVTKKMKAINFSRANLSYNFPLMKRYLPLGMCSFLSQISLVISVASVNIMIKKYGALDPIFGQSEYSQIPMAVIGIVMKFFQIVISIVVGLSASCTPIVGYNVGAERPDRVRNLFTLLLKCEVILGFVAFIIVEFFPESIAELFGASGESVYYADFTVKCFRTYLCLIVLACVNKAAFIFIQAMGRPYLSALLSIVREVIFGAGLVIVMPIFMGLDGVLWSMPASDALTFIISFVVIFMIYRDLKNLDSSSKEKDNANQSTE
ncbi:MAG: MATE family efflux transporter [Synergistaceae bacterium]|nr:MATE family efflux transporter [Synergistaceae bacterium]